VDHDTTLGFFLFRLISCGHHCLFWNGRKVIICVTRNLQASVKIRMRVLSSLSVSVDL
jgi:hypothetical protein